MDGRVKHAPPKNAPRNGVMAALEGYSTGGPERKARRGVDSVGELDAVRRAQRDRAQQARRHERGSGCELRDIRAGQALFRRQLLVGRAPVWTPSTPISRMPASAC